MGYNQPLGKPILPRQWALDELATEVEILVDTLHEARIIGRRLEELVDELLGEPLKV